MRAVYASSTLSLAALEYLVHVDPEDVPSDLVALALDIPDHAIVDMETRAVVPANWRAAIAPDACRQIGGDWIASGTSLGLAVPSVIIPDERNVLLNPGHAEMGTVRVHSSAGFAFDPRLLYRG